MGVGRKRRGPGMAAAAKAVANGGAAVLSRSACHSRLPPPLRGRVVAYSRRQAEVGGRDGVVRRAPPHPDRPGLRPSRSDLSPLGRGEGRPRPTRVMAPRRHVLPGSSARSVPLDYLSPVGRGREPGVRPGERVRGRRAKSSRALPSPTRRRCGRLDLGPAETRPKRDGLHEGKDHNGGHGDETGAGRRLQPARLGLGVG